MKTESQISDFLKNELLNNKSLFDENIYRVLFGNAFENFEGRKTIADSLFEFLKQDIPNLKDYFFTFYAEYMNRIGKLSTHYNFDDFIIYIYKMYLEWCDINQKQPAGEQEIPQVVVAPQEIPHSQKIREAEELAKRHRIVIREPAKEIIATKTKALPVAESSMVRTQTSKNGIKPNIKPIKAHGSGRIFNLEEFKNRELVEGFQTDDKV